MSVVKCDVDHSQSASVDAKLTEKRCAPARMDFRQCDGDDDDGEEGEEWFLPNRVGQVA